MSKRTKDESSSPGTQKKQKCINATSEGSSVDADSGRLFPDTERENPGPEATLDNPPEDTDNMDTPDTRARAKTLMEKLGPWEVECSYEGEAGLQEHFNNCQKNPDHRNFIPVEEFSIDHLPEECRDMDVVDYIRAVSDLTVRVTVKYVSDSRPATTGISEKPYPNYSDRGKRKITVGTGFVNNVYVYNDDREWTCQCKDCKNSSTPRTTFGEIYIHTAAHVVFDSKEGEHTTCHLFYDRGFPPETCSGAVKLSGMLCTWTDPDDDVCELIHYTHDVDLAERLAQICEQRDQSKDKIRSRSPQTLKYQWTRPTPDKQPLLFIVSHPHGYSKHISIGRWTSRLGVHYATYIYMYSTATCRGSSGAPVYLPGWSDVSHSEWDFFWGHCTHAGASEIQPGLNFCQSDGLPMIFERVSLDFMLHNEEPWENNFSCVEEEDLHKHYDTCQKNPGHLNFFPIDKFSLDHLPPFYRTDEVMKLIKTVADVTVRVSVRYVSEERPETVPGTDIPYPWYRNRGSNQLRVGSGIITRVDLFPHKACKCQECKNVDTKTMGYARVQIQTAAHLVYDELEAGQTTCHLFSNAGETFAACKGAVPLTNASVNGIFREHDRCELIYYTHDLDLAGRLLTLFNVYDEYVDVLKDYNHEGFFNVPEDAEQTGRNKSALEPRLNIVVSHPHGCAKQVSLAHCGCHGNTDTQQHRCPYKLIACPGSSGACVIYLGWDFLYPSLEYTSKPDMPNQISQK
ncbi:hypothetical protein BsWGS_27123 [Bradybaena similaris]